MFTLNLINLYMTQHDCTAAPDWRNVKSVQHSILIHFSLCNAQRSLLSLFVLFTVGLVFLLNQMEEEAWIILFV